MAIGRTTRSTMKKGAGAAGGTQQVRGVRQGNSALAQGSRLVRKAGKSRREGLSA